MAAALWWFQQISLLGEMITIMCFVGEGVSLEVVVVFFLRLL